MDKHSFYESKTLVEVEWWVSYASETSGLLWARLRIFSDGSADAAFEEFKVYGFSDRKYAGYFLGEDEYMPFESMNAEDEEFIGIKKSEVSPPNWDEIRAREFKCVGEY